MKRSGGKFTPRHTTVIDAASVVVDFAHKQPRINKISLGLITPLKSSGGIKRMKIVQEVACLFVTIRGNTSMQELRFFTNEKDALEKDLKKFARAKGFKV